VNWTYESWRKLYVRETGEFASLSWMARAVAAMLLKYVDDRGRIFPRAGDDIEDAICARMGADRGERRMIRPAIAELIKDGHLVRVGPGVRIKNFIPAQGRTVSTDLIANDQRLGDEGVTTASPSVNDGATTEPPPCDEPPTTVERTSNEEQPKCAQTLSTDPDVPSVPSDPSVPKPEGALSPARDPGASDTEPTAALRCTGYDLTKMYGRERSIACDGRVEPWRTPVSTDGKAETFASSLTPDEIRDALPTMKIHFADLVAGRGKAGALQSPNLGFGCWMADLTALRERLHGKTPGARPPARASPPPQQGLCGFHQPATTANRKAPKHDPACSECRHVAAKERPKTETEPGPAFGGVR
jgi:hypothetical protein